MAQIPRDSYQFFEPITPHDSTNISGGPTDAIWVGGAGIAQVVGLDDVVTPFTCVAGSLLPVRAKRVNTTSGTASLMVALYR